MPRSAVAGIHRNNSRLRLRSIRMTKMHRKQHRHRNRLTAATRRPEPQSPRANQRRRVEGGHTGRLIQPRTVTQHGPVGVHVQAQHHVSFYPTQILGHGILKRQRFVRHLRRFVRLPTQKPAVTRRAQRPAPLGTAGTEEGQQPERARVGKESFQRIVGHRSIHPSMYKNPHPQ